MRDHPADLMLVDMGFNDLGWFYSDDVELVNNTWTFIQNTRRASPNMKFVLATIGMEREDRLSCRWLTAFPSTPNISWWAARSRQDD